MVATNAMVADRLRRAAELLQAQGADAFRVQAYRRAADTIDGLDDDVTRLFAEGGRDALEALPHIGAGIAGAVAKLMIRGRWTLLERLEGEVTPEALLASVPGIGAELARRIHATLGVETLEALELAAHEGRLAEVPGIGQRRAEAIRAAAGERLARLRPRRRAAGGEPDVGVLLDVDEAYRSAAAAGRLPRIAPKRFNPTGEAWLPILHTQRGRWSFTALYSNTAQAHALDRVHDWVVLYFHDDGDEGQRTVVTERTGPLAGRRVVRGREAECAAQADAAAAWGASTRRRTGAGAPATRSAPKTETVPRRPQAGLRHGGVPLDEIGATGFGLALEDAHVVRHLAARGGRVVADRGATAVDPAGRDVAGRETPLVLEGANIPITPDAEAALHARGVACLPDFVANAGGAIYAAAEGPPPAAAVVLAAARLRAAMGYRRCRRGPIHARRRERRRRRTPYRDGIVPLRGEEALSLSDDRYGVGETVRREVLGDSHMDQAEAAKSEIDEPFEHFVTESVWGTVWARPDLDRRTRSMLVIALLAQQGQDEELARHLRATRNTGVSAAEVRETILMVAAYAGTPAASRAMRIAKQVHGEEQGTAP